MFAAVTTPLKHSCLQAYLSCRYLQFRLATCVSSHILLVWLVVWPLPQGHPDRLPAGSLPAFKSYLHCTALPPTRTIHLHTHCLLPCAHCLHCTYTHRLTGLTHHECPAAIHNLSHTHTFTLTSNVCCQ